MCQNDIALAFTTFMHEIFSFFIIFILLFSSSQPSAYTCRKICESQRDVYQSRHAMLQGKVGLRSASDVAREFLIRY